MNHNKGLTENVLGCKRYSVGGGGRSIEIQRRPRATKRDQAEVNGCQGRERIGGHVQNNFT